MTLFPSQFPPCPPCRPVLAVLDVQGRVVDSALREEVVDTLLETLGPSDGTVVSTPLAGGLKDSSNVGGFS